LLLSQALQSELELLVLTRSSLNPFGLEALLFEAAAEGHQRSERQLGAIVVVKLATLANSLFENLLCAALIQSLLYFTLRQALAWRRLSIKGAKQSPALLVPREKAHDEGDERYYGKCECCELISELGQILSSEPVGASFSKY